ncbi:MAG: hypothetical protein HOP11_09705 [Saprospiraceae bacterium]|nr:hypothetical protein [Saprospiraceae bacterium]
MYNINAFKEAEIIVRSPGRINLIGEHTDYNSGYCLPASISKAIYFGIQPSSKIQIHALDFNQYTSDLDQKFSWEIYFIGVLNLLEKEGFKIPAFAVKFSGDLPSGAGLSSSSSIVCGFLYLLNEYYSLGLDKMKLTEYAVRAERANGLMGGMMDQISIMNGAKNKAIWIRCDTWSFTEVPVNLTDSEWLVIDTKVKHNLIQTDYNSRSLSCQSIREKLLKNSLINSHISQIDSNSLKSVRNLLTEQEFIYLSYVVEENERVLNFIEKIRSGDKISLGKILIDGHKGLKDKYNVSCKELDFLVDFATDDQDCYGAKMMGGGFGGSTIHLLHKDYVEEYQNKISLAFKNKFGFNPDIFVAQIEDGVSLYTKN